jgi:hypothetical protein
MGDRNKLIVIALIIILLGISIGFTGLGVYAACYVLGLFGIMIHFTWKLVLAIWIIFGVFGSFIKGNKN